MARPKNTKLKEQLLAAAWKSFRERGYDATSYHVIAEMCGVQRNLAQYHYPKKEEFASRLLTELLEQSHAALGISPADLDDDFTNLYALCVCYFQFLLQDGGYGAFLHDIVRDRDLMARTVPLDAEWLLSHLHRRSENAGARAAHGIVGAFGSFYAILYQSLESGRSFDVPRELEPLMQACMRADSYTQTDIQRNTVGMRFDPTRTTVAIHRLNQVIL